MSSIEPHLKPLKTIQRIDELLELQQFALEHIQEAIFLIDSDARITYVNKAASTSLGYTKEELLSMSVFDLDPQFPSDTWQEHWQELKENKNLLFETEHKRIDEVIIPVEVNANYFEYNGVGYNMALSRDITKKKNEEKISQLNTEQLQEATTKLSALFSNIPDMIWMKDYEGKYLSCNAAYESLIGVKEVELIGKTDYDFYSFESAEVCKQSDSEAIDAGKLCISEEAVTYRDNSIGILEIRKVPIYYPDGTLKGVLGIARDIIERKKIEQKLAASEREFRALAEQTLDTIARYDHECIRIYANPALAHAMGLSVSEILGKKPTSYFPSAQAIAYEEKIKEVLATGIQGEIEYSWPDASGRTLTSQIRIVPEITEEGVTRSVLATGRDITTQKELHKFLSKREEDFRSLAENAQDPIYRYDRECRRVYVNPAVERLSGKPSSLLLGKMPTEEKLVSPQESIKVLNSLKQVLNTGIKDEIDVTFVTPDGKKHYYQHSHVPEFGSDGTINGVLAIGHDITAQKELHNDLNMREQMFRALAENSPNIIMRYDRNCIRVYVNPAYAEQTGIPQNIAINAKPDMQWKMYIHMLSMSAEEYQERILNVIQSGVPDTFIVAWYRLNDGGYVAHDLNVVAERDLEGNITGALAIGHNITERIITEQKIEHMAHHDALTGLPNRILAQDRTEQVLAHAKRNGEKAALLFIDLDGFKTINDTMGHSVGDTVLKTVAIRLSDVIRESDTISRQGGDEFLVLLSDINDSDDIVIIAEKLLNTFEQSLNVVDQFLSLSASIGIALYPDHGENFETLLQSADTAMYKAKEQGKNGYCFFDQQMNHNITGQFKLQNDLKNAIQKNEFILHYQPQIDLKQNRIIGVEALIRWNHPHLGMVPPMHFIPLAESSGLIVPIGQWVIEESCRQAALWHDMGITVCVAVNISAVQFKRGNLEIVVKNALKISGLNPKFFELELTESTMMHNLESTLQTVKALKELGIQLSIDDFGTGYSSLAYLKRFAVDKLKIDQSFVRDIVQDQEDAIIVNTIIQMAKSLNLKSIAEGVENQEVLNILKNFGCDEIQGYHYAKPLEASEFERYFTSQLHKEKLNLQRKN